MPLGLIVPGLPHPLLVPGANPGYQRVADAFAAARQRIAASGADTLLLYSTQWPSVIGHQVQADPNPEWVHVDPEFHELGSMPYRFRMDAELAEGIVGAARKRGLHARTVAYKGFPIDTGTVVALKLLDPDNNLRASVVSCNMYADRSETLVLGKAAADAIERLGRRCVPVAVTSLSARQHTRPIDLANDRLSSLSDDEWNRKLLELLGEGRLEDVSQLARTFTAQAHADNKLKAIWWLSACLGQHNRYRGDVLAYEPLYGTGGAVVLLQPGASEAADHEFDEDDADVYGGDREVLDAGASHLEGAVGVASNTGVTSTHATRVSPTEPASAPAARSGSVTTDTAPKPVGAYPHARRVGDLLYLSGVGPRQAGDNSIPGGPVRDASGAPLNYDIEAQTRAVVANVRLILEAGGSSLDQVLDVTAFLIDMDRDFAGYNKVYAELLGPYGATRTTLAVTALPTPIAVELKVIAAAGPQVVR
jgi:2-aminophenol/2-amino-5-chlorophenol 1,6-dioxygenase subunit alpha